MSASELYEAGKLKEAIAAQNEEVKKHPEDTGRRGFLCELLCFAGDFERADKHLEVIGKQDSKAMIGVALFRQLVRAEQARQQFYSEGRLPEFLTEPAEHLKLHLEASIRIREGNLAEAAEFLARAEEQRPKLPGTCDEQPFDDLRDLDDLTAPIFEILTSNGKYYWVPAEQVELIEFHPPERPRDLLWRRGHMIVSGGPDGEVYFPTVYVGSLTDADERIHLGRVTDWRTAVGAPVRGIGQRTFLVGDVDKPILQIQNITR